ncbi:hypothetical protein DVH05_004637 [Phytophthora capsici]|nr:hypothetical protein DVH05_004637 [Phytophthora capsici]
MQKEDYKLTYQDTNRNLSFESGRNFDIMDSTLDFMYVHMHVDQPRRTPSTFSRHIDWYSTDSLRYHSRHEIPLIVSVSPTTDSDVVVYNCSITNDVSKTVAIVGYRYSEFVDFRTKLNDLWTCHDLNCSGSCQTLRDIVTAFFPMKRLPVLSTSRGATTSRSAKFELVLTHLLRSVLIPGNVMKCMHARENLPDNVFKFLGIKGETDKRSVLQIFIDKYQNEVEQGGVPISPAQECMICLNNVNSQQEDSGTETESDGEDNGQEDLRTVDTDAKIVLPCKHSFHRKCIFQWLLFEFHCPVCRTNLCPNAFTHYCRAHRSEPQWWLSVFQEDLQLTSQNE